MINRQALLKFLELKSEHLKTKNVDEFLKKLGLSDEQKKEVQKAGGKLTNSTKESIASMFNEAIEIWSQSEVLDENSYKTPYNLYPNAYSKT